MPPNIPVPAGPSRTPRRGGRRWPKRCRQPCVTETSALIRWPASRSTPCHRRCSPSTPRDSRCDRRSCGWTYGRPSRPSGWLTPNTPRSSATATVRSQPSSVCPRRCGFATMSPRSTIGLGTSSTVPIGPPTASPASPPCRSTRRPASTTSTAARPGGRETCTPNLMPPTCWRSFPNRCRKSAPPWADYGARWPSSSV